MSGPENKVSRGDYYRDHLASLVGENDEQIGERFDHRHGRGMITC
jgi:hypothetical protein